MTDISSGRLTASFVTEPSGSVENTTGPYSWNTPKKAVNPYLEPADVEPESALSNLIALYAADNEQEQLRRETLSDEVWERYFFNESRDPVQRLLSISRTGRQTGYAICCPGKLI